MAVYNDDSRPLLPSEEVSELERKGLLAVREGAERTRFFDGKFLTARDLIREQEYFLQRQGRIGRAIGSGVVDGLMVERVEGSGRVVRIAPGHGITGQGEMVVLPEEISIDINNVPRIQQLNRAFGLDNMPRQPSRNRFGLFIIALRPIEYTANPTTSYPKSVNGKATVQDGAIIEGVAVSFVPYPMQLRREDFNASRAIVAREVFGREGDVPVGENMLPLAMVAVDNGFIRWMDVFMVRREVGDNSDALGFGFAPRPLRAAYLRQYNQHFNEVMARLRGPMTAANHFRALPPAGPMDKNSINPADFTQSFFPVDVEADLSVMPEDELMAMLEDSLLMPPIDLQDSREALQATSVLIVLALSRADVYELANGLETVTRDMRTRYTLSSSVARLRPYDGLVDLMRRSPFLTTLQPPSSGATDPAEPWRLALERATSVWFVRRRNLSYRNEVAGLNVTLRDGIPIPLLNAPQPEPDEPTPEPDEPTPEPDEPTPEPDEPTPEPGPDFEIAPEFAEILANLQLTTRFNRFLNSAPSENAADFAQRVQEMVLAGEIENPLLIYSLINELAEAPRLTVERFEIILERHIRDEIREGINILAELEPRFIENADARRVLGSSLVVPEIGFMFVREFDGVITFDEFIAQLQEAAATGTTLVARAGAVREFVTEVAESLGIEMPLIP